MATLVEALFIVRIGMMTLGMQEEEILILELGWVEL